MEQKQGRVREGKGPYLFQKDWEDGYDPSKPTIETKDKDGKTLHKKPTGKAYSVLDMTDEELGDFLGEEERKALKVARQQRKEFAGRDMCKEAQEAKERETETLKERNRVLEQWAREQEAKQKKMEKDMEKMANLLAQLLPK